LFVTSARDFPEHLENMGDLLTPIPSALTVATKEILVSPETMYVFCPSVFRPSILCYEKSFLCFVLLDFHTTKILNPIQEASKSSVDFTRECRTSLIYISPVGNTIYAPKGPKRPSLNDI
jgi:hypothetical protein